MNGDGHEPTLWDAYVSYGEADRDWVENVLVPRLIEAGRRILLDRDLAPGGIEIEERCRALAASRRTLLVVSSSFVDESWSPLEEAVTRELDPAGRKRRLIPVVREDCDLPLRIRPLVAVDLRREEDPKPWKRLIDALDPDSEPPSVRPMQRLSLGLAEATASLEEPTWHPTGTAWLILGYSAFIALTALVAVTLDHAPALSRTLVLVLSAPPHALGLVARHEDRDVFQRLSHFLGRSRWGRSGVSASAACITALWVFAGWPAVRSALCGPAGCPESGVTYLTIDAFDALTDSLVDPAAWSEGTSRILREKLHSIEGLQVLGLATTGLDAEALRAFPFDFHIGGRIEPGPVLVAEIADRKARRYLPSVRVNATGRPDSPDEIAGAAWIRSTQDRLAQQVLERLGLRLTPAERARIDRLPTANLHAARLNDDAVEALQEGRLEAARALLETALELDPEFAAAWSNGAEVAWRQGDPERALRYRREAVSRLPAYAPLHYNLGHTLVSLGYDHEAVTALEKALELDRAHVEAANELGKTYQRLRRLEEAEQILRQGRVFGHRFAPAAKNLGSVLLDLGHTEEARTVLTEALSLYPEADWLGRCETRALLVATAALDARSTAVCEHLGALERLDPQNIAPWTPGALQAAAPFACSTNP